MLKNTFKVSIDMGFAQFKMFVMAFWGLPQSSFDMYELTNSTMMVLSDGPFYEEPLNDNNSVYMNKRFTKGYVRKSAISEMDSVRASHVDSHLRESSVKPRKLKYRELDLHSEGVDRDRDSGFKGVSVSHKKSTTQKWNSVFNDKGILGRSQLANADKLKSKKNYLYEFPFASVSEVNLIKKTDIDYYKDLLSIDKKGII